MIFSLLDEKTSLDQFNCGDEDLDSFLKNLAIVFQRRHFGITIICSDKTGHIIGYYTLCPACVERGKLPNKMLTGTRPDPIPAFRICRFAVDINFQGKGYGKMLLVHAMKKCIDQAEQIGGNMIIIDAKHEQAKKFYKHFGFVPLHDSSLVLVQTIKFIKMHFNDNSP